MEHPIHEKILAHPVWTGKCPTREEWAQVKDISKPLRFKLGDRAHPSDHEKVFCSYNPETANGLQWIPLAKYMASAKYRREGELNPCRKRTEQEKRAASVAKNKRLYAAKRDLHRARMESDPEYRAHIHARDNARYKKNRTIYLARAQTPEYVIKKSLRGSIKKYVGTISSGINRKNNDGARFLIWLAARNGVPVPNGAEWHIDHLIPISRFDLSIESERLRVNAPENLRWLKAFDNYSKHDNMPSPEEVAAHLEVVAEWRAAV